MKKKILSVILSLTMAVGLITAMSQQTQAAVPLDDIAYGKRMSSSSYNHRSSFPHFAVDNDFSTYFEAAGGKDEYIMIDLGAVYDVEDITITWGYNYVPPVKQYEISYGTSEDNMEVGVLAAGVVYASRENLNDSMRYIKIRCVDCVDSYKMRIYDIKVRGEIQPGYTEPPIDVLFKGNYDISTGKTAFASSSENQVFIPENILDGDMNTRWSSTAEDNQWIAIDLGDYYVINDLKLYWETAYASNYSIYMSTDGETWKLAGTYDKSEPGTDMIEYGNKIARYIKIQGNTRATDYGISLHEVAVRGYN